MNYLNYEKIPELLLPHYYRTKRNLPWRKDSDPYHVWIAEIMLQQTRIETVIPYYERFLASFPTVKELSEATEEKLLKLWEGLGYYSRARNLKKAAQQIMENYHGVFPADLSAILSLKGIGPYTAGAIASISFNQKEPAMDGNVFRVFSRLSQEERPIHDVSYKKELYQLLKKIYPPQAKDFTEGLMELGETVCLPNTAPLCTDCPLSSLCLSYRNGTQLRYPRIEKKGKIKIEERCIFLLRYNGKYAVRQRPDSGLLASLYEFPNCPSAERGEFLSAFTLTSQTELTRYKHLFSHIHWHNTLFLCEVVKTAGDYRWLTKEEIKEKVAIPSAFLKVMNYL